MNTYLLAANIFLTHFKDKLCPIWTPYKLIYGVIDSIGRKDTVTFSFEIVPYFH